MRWQGVVHGNVVELDEGAQLPDGIRVTVMINPADLKPEEMTSEQHAQRQEWVGQLEAFGQRLAGRNVELGARILEGREELEARA